MHDEFWDYDTHPPGERNEIVKSRMPSWFVSSSALAAGGNVTQQLPCVATLPLSTQLLWLLGNRLGPYNHAPVKGYQKLQRCQKKILEHAEKCTRAQAHMNELKKKKVPCYYATRSTGLLPNIIALSSLQMVAVCVNTSGQCSLTHHHLT